MLLLAVFPVAMIFGAIWDLTTMTIPNRLTIALVAAFVLLAPLAGLSLQQIGMHVAAGAAMLLVGMALFGLGWIGGGDANGFASLSVDRLGAGRRVDVGPALFPTTAIARFHVSPRMDRAAARPRRRRSLRHCARGGGPDCFSAHGLDRTGGFGRLKNEADTGVRAMKGMEK